MTEKNAFNYTKMKLEGDKMSVVNVLIEYASTQQMHKQLTNKHSQN